MKAKAYTQKDSEREPQPGETTRVIYLESGSELDKYFLKVDPEIMKEFDYGPIDDESI